MKGYVDKMNRTIQIILIQCAGALLVWLLLWNVPLFRTAPSKQIVNISDDSLVHLSKSLAFYRTVDQFKAEDEIILKEQVQKLAQALDWKEEHVQLYPRLPIDGVIPIDVRLEFVAQPQSIPIFLSGLARLSYGGVLEKLEYSMDKNRCFIQLRFLRTNPRAPSWIQEESTLSEKEKSIVQQGFMLMFWKSFYIKQQERKQNNPISKPIFLMELSRRHGVFIPSTFISFCSPGSCWLGN